MKGEDTILWILGIVLFLILAANIPSISKFAIVTETVCVEGVTSYWDLDGNFLDSRGVNNGINNGAIFVTGKINQGVEFNTLNSINFPEVSGDVGMWLKDYSNVGSDWYYSELIEGVNYVNGIQDDTRPIIPLSSNFGLGFNGSVDEIKIGEDISGLSEIQPCYVVTTYENVTCKEYATYQVIDSGTGCLNYSGDFFPDCTYQWENTTTYFIEDNLCEKNFYCESGYSTPQECVEQLEYDCYAIVNNNCVAKTDYDSCVIGNSYLELDECQDGTTISTTSTTTTEEEKTDIQSLATKELFNLFGFSINAIHLLILLILIVGVLYLSGAFGK